MRRRDVTSEVWPQTCNQSLVEVLDVMVGQTAMMDRMRQATIVLLLLSGGVPALGCKCDLSLDVCAETLQSNLIFVGTVESVSPNIMTRWEPSMGEPVLRMNRALERYLQNSSAERLAALKDAAREAIPGLGAEAKQRLAEATDLRGVARVLNSVMAGSRTARFRVRTVFRHEDDEAVPDALDVQTPLGDCGNDFQVGETYLVFANSDEETETLWTSTCTRTQRASDAGADLAYLMFYKDREHPAGRVQGFATYDLRYLAHPSGPDRIPQPAEGVVVALASGGRVLYTTANAFGQFVFDGLDAGDYNVTAYAPGFPDNPRVLSGPQRFRLEGRACTTRVLPILKDVP